MIPAQTTAVQAETFLKVAQATNDTNFYLLALAEYRRANPRRRRDYEVTTADLSAILIRAQNLKVAHAMITIESRIA